MPHAIGHPTQILWLAPADCWVPDYCNAKTFRYKRCRLQLHGRHRHSKTKEEHGCPKGEYCEEVECKDRCFLPANCTCETEHHGKLGRRHRHGGRMICAKKGCFKHPTTQWGICRPDPTEEEVQQVRKKWRKEHGHDDDDDDDDDEDDIIMPTGFHFYSSAWGLRNAKLHIDEDSPMARPRVGSGPAPKTKAELRPPEHGGPQYSEKDDL